MVQAEDRLLSFGRIASRFALAGVVALSIGVTACGGGGGGGGQSGGGAQNVKATEYKFDPANVNAEAGKQVTITLDNQGTIAHDWKAEGITGAEIGETPAKQKKSVTFTAPAAGTYKVLCTLPGHAEAGMVGQLVVK